MTAKSISNFTHQIQITISDKEAGALDALAGYGTDQFLDVFYAHLGKSYLKPYEEGLRLLFETIKKEIPPHLEHGKNVRDVIEGKKIAIDPRKIKKP